jgi:DNA-binding MarR family transcriptional regulator
MNVEEILKTEKKIPLESRSVIHVLLINRKIGEKITAVLKPFGVSPQQFNVLRIVRGQQGNPANLSDLNDRMITKMSNTTRLVDKLLHKGYLNRVVCPSNRRKVEITITTKGREALLEMDKMVTGMEKELVSGFTKNELEQLNELLDKF